jgi:hypothetical protein
VRAEAAQSFVGEIPKTKTHFPPPQPISCSQATHFTKILQIIITYGPFTLLNVMTLPYSQSLKVKLSFEGMNQQAF